MGRCGCPVLTGLCLHIPQKARREVHVEAEQVEGHAHGHDEQQQLRPELVLLRGRVFRHGEERWRESAEHKIQRIGGVCGELLLLLLLYYCSCTGIRWETTGAS